jgi:HAD superfamily hydrolase (TIGR01490 family)
MAGTLALFDLDGTLTTRDTMFAFAADVAGPLRLGLALLWHAPRLALLALGRAPAGPTKGALLATCFRHLDRAQLEAGARRFAAARMPGLLRPGAEAALRAHQQAGHTVLLVSASFDLWVLPWAEAMGLRALATPAAWAGGRFAGIGGPNNHGPEKVRRVQAVVDPAGFDHIVAYGDSSGDRELLALAHEARWRPFRGG